MKAFITFLILIMLAASCERIDESDRTTVSTFAFLTDKGSTMKERNTSLKKQALQPLPLGSIKPAGWLYDQLRIQADGLSGHLDEFWPDVKNSGWFGGDAESWERAPYWFDGVVPLVYLLDDEALK